MFNTINFDTADLRPVLITGPARTTRAREFIDAIVAASSGTVTVARRLDEITDAVINPSTSKLVGVLDTAALSIREDLRGLLSSAQAAGVQLLVLSRTVEAVPDELRAYLREVAA
ncbi:hypothetical protein [Tsukamurella paurometabola]|uniref:Uncharacterized protein n=1 Tax=Tsukamurella paurometabola TaxID=2061 RepID=A0A3P8MCC5_TSUPA|nr:hypothetical protein [Tsukamurella paurometabola]UEA83287.1 hypothetical protein LK411_00035 [Tsukamurella paurometabola]VDR40390.1 Uncharacterised protein [Tsukamurella paurometabola]